MLGSFSGGGLGFGVAFQLKDEFSDAARKIENEFSRLDQLSSQMAAQVDRSMNQITTGFGMMAAGAVMLAPIVASINIAGDFEQTQIAFETLTGSASNALVMLNNLKEFAKKTPFEFQELASLTKQLLAYGIQQKDIMGDLKALGDLASGVGVDKLPSITLAFGQVFAKGKLAGGELRQFAEQGIPLLDELAKKFGVTTAVMGDMITEGKIGFEDVREVLYKLTGENGRFANLMDKQSASFKGQWSNVKDSLYQAAIAIGTVFIPVVKTLIGYVATAVGWLKSFAESPFGAFIMKIVAILGTLLVIVGAILMVMGGWRWLIMKAAMAFGAMTRATILQTIATKGLTAGIKVMARSLWTALAPIMLILAPILLFIWLIKKMKEMLNSASPVVRMFGLALMIALGPIGWIIGAITLMKRAIREFDSIGQDGSGIKTGFIGWLQKLGGILRGVQAIWRSWSDETRTFKLPKALEEKLDRLGILQTVINLGTWIARIKAFLKGMKDAFVEVFTVVKNWIKGVLEKFGALDEKLGGFGIHIGKNKDSMQKWHDIGKKVGYALLIILGLVLVSFILMGIAALIFVVIMIVLFALMFAPFILLGILIYKVIQWFKQLKAWAADTATSIATFFGDLVAWFEGLPGRMYQAGVDFVDNLWTGISDMWTSFVNWLSAAWENVLSWFGLGDIAATVTHETPPATGKPNYMMPSADGWKGTNDATAQDNAKKTAEAKAVNSPNGFAQSNALNLPGANKTTPQVLNASIYMDGKKIGDHVANVMATDAASQ